MITWSPETEEFLKATDRAGMPFVRAAYERRERTAWGRRLAELMAIERTFLDIAELHP